MQTIFFSKPAPQLSKRRHGNENYYCFSVYAPISFVVDGQKYFSIVHYLCNQIGNRFSNNDVKREVGKFREKWENHFGGFRPCIEIAKNFSGRDWETWTNELQKIMNSGYSTPTFNPLVWEEELEENLMQSTYQKFRENDDIIDILLDTGDTQLAYDIIDTQLGCGKIINGTWSGSNFVGKVLEKIREKLREELNHKTPIDVGINIGISNDNNRTGNVVPIEKKIVAPKRERTAEIKERPKTKEEERRERLLKERLDAEEKARNDKIERKKQIEENRRKSHLERRSRKNDEIIQGISNGAKLDVEIIDDIPEPTIQLNPITAEDIANFAAERDEEITPENDGEITPENEEVITPDNDNEITPENEEEITPENEEVITPENDEKINTITTEDIAKFAAEREEEFTIEDMDEAIERCAAEFAENEEEENKEEEENEEEENNEEENDEENEEKDNDIDIAKILNAMIEEEKETSKKRKPDAEIEPPKKRRGRRKGVAKSQKKST